MPTGLDLSTIPEEQRNNPMVNAVIVKMPSVNGLLDPLISGYSTPYTYTALAGDNNKKLVKGTPCLVGALMISNNTSVRKIITFYDKATAPLSSDTPIINLAVPPNTLFAFPLSSGLRFANGLGFIIMTDAGLVSFLGTALTGIAAGDVTINLIYTS